jgi:hypothetical protein
MAKGYPSRSRARKAYLRGVKAAKTGRGINPYRNARLKDLFDRGRNNTPRTGGTGPMRSSGNAGNAGDFGNRPRQGGFKRDRDTGPSSSGSGSGSGSGWNRRRI